jgi:hypothetical protein
MWGSSPWITATPVHEHTDKNMSEANDLKLSEVCKQQEREREREFRRYKELILTSHQEQTQADHLTVHVRKYKQHSFGGGGGKSNGYIFIQKNKSHSQACGLRGHNFR